MPPSIPSTSEACQYQTADCKVYAVRVDDRPHPFRIASKHGSRLKDCCHESVSCRNGLKRKRIQNDVSSVFSRGNRLPWKRHRFSRRHPSNHSSLMEQAFMEQWNRPNFLSTISFPAATIHCLLYTSSYQNVRHTSDREHINDTD